MWINFYARKKTRRTLDQFDNPIVEEYVIFDTVKKQEDDEWLSYVQKNKGKFVPVIDDITGEPLTERELEELETLSAIPTIIVPLEDGKPVHKRTRSTRKYKSRLSISPELRRIVYELADNACNKCGNKNANQIHHVDHDPSNNHVHNLQLLCYDCHLVADGKKTFRINKPDDECDDSDW